MHKDVVGGHSRVEVEEDASLAEGANATSSLPAGNGDEKVWKSMSIGGEQPNNSFASADNTRIAQLASTLSWFVNWFLLAAKIYVVVVSSSKAVTAALADSAVDLVSQAVLSLAESYMQTHSPDYPVGRARLEALSVLACAFIMSMASIEVIQYSITDLYDGINGNLPALDVDVATYSILGIGIFFKIFLWFFCKWANTILTSDMIDALAEDHFNDILSNSAAIATAAIAFNVKGYWWVDPAGATLISVVIIVRWVYIMVEQVKKIVGHTAPPEFIDKVEAIARAHDHRLQVDCTRAYHFGQRYNVEMEVVLPGSMTVIESHDIALALQHKIEGLVDVERAFVHVDHEQRDGLEHKVERELVKNSANPIINPDPSPTSNSNELRSRNKVLGAGGA